MGDEASGADEKHSEAKEPVADEAPAREEVATFTATEEAPKAEEAPKVEEAPAEKAEEAPKVEEAKTEEAPAEKAEEAPKAEEALKAEEAKAEEAKPEEAPKAEEPKQEEPPPPPPPPPPPSILGVEPDHGPLSGGVMVKVRGEAFVEGAKVLVAGAEAKTTFVEPTELHAELPAHDKRGLVELRVVNPDEQFAVYEDDFRYDPPPAIAGVEPACFSTEGGAVVTILGSDFAQGCGVSIDGALVPSSWINAGRLEAVIKAHEPGAADVVVKNPDGQTGTRAGAVRFAEPPVIEAITPATDFTVGGAGVQISGHGFEEGCQVLVAGEPLEGVTFESATSLRFTAPPHAGVEAVDVAVVNPTGLVCRRMRAFSYLKAPPRVTSMSPDRGPNAGGTGLRVLGRDFDQKCSVFLCGIASAVTWKSSEELEVVTPAVARDGLVDLRVVNTDDQAFTLEKAFRYDAPLPPPALREVAPRSGSQVGGLKVSLYGEDFADGCTVRFGGVAAEVHFKTGKELEVIVPAYAGSGEVTVEVVNPDGVASAVEAAFIYEARPAPEITGITPTFGPTTGGTKVVIEGKNFTRECTVYLGREYTKDFAFKSATELVIVTAARKQPGVVDVEVAMPGVPKGVMKNGFRYDAVPAPVITSVSPNAGGIGGGTEMSISGKNFLKESVVLVDGKPPKAVKFVNTTLLELKTPPGEAGKMADVVVRNPDGKEAVQKRAFLYDPRYRG